MDEFGRILTPKEAWRQLNYKFHGFGSSRNKQEKAVRKYAEELKTKKASSSVHLVRQAQRKEERARSAGGSAFTVMSGEIKPGQTRDAVGKYATRADD